MRTAAKVLCRAGHHVKSKQCVPCAKGYTRGAGDDVLGGDTECEVLRCAENEKVSNHKCLPCEKGRTNTAGDNASGDDTECAGANH